MKKEPKAKTPNEKEKHLERLLSTCNLDEHSEKIFREVYLELSSIRIGDLREMARRMRVKSGTTMEKLKLVEVMTKLKVSNTVYCPPTKMDVGPVTLKDVEDITDDYIGNTMVLNATEVEGILDIDAYGAWLRVNGFRASDKDVFVPMLLVNERLLVRGDKIKGQGRFLTGCGRFGLFSIDTLNDIPFKKFKRVQLDEATTPTEIIKLDRSSRAFNALMTSAPFAFGQRRMVVGIDAYRMDNLAREIVKNLNQAGFLTVGMFFDETPEGQKHTAELPGLNLSMNCEEFENYDIQASLAVEYAKSQACSGKNVMLLINNADALSEKTLRTIFGAGKYTKNGSVSPIIMSSSLELCPLINRLSRSANAITLFKNGFGGEALIDVRRSFADSEDLLSQEEKDTLKDVRRQLADQYVSVKEYMSAYDILLASNQE